MSFLYRYRIPLSYVKIEYKKTYPHHHDCPEQICKKNQILFISEYFIQSVLEGNGQTFAGYFIEWFIIFIFA